MAVKVKICGLTNLADAQAALAAGADMLGFIFFPKSPRYIAPEQVREIIRLLDRRPPPAMTCHACPPAAGDRRLAVTTVGVFVDESSAAVAHILDFCGLDLAQLHGEEPPEMVAGDLHGRSYKALRPRSLDEALDLASQYVLASSLGGTGETGDWSLAAALAGRYPLLLAGGLCPANVAEAVRAVRPWGVDVSSGVESAPGQKDHAAVRAFVAAAKAISGRKSAADNQWNGVYL
jgi:phosphoribosylanthranilate isomerase